MSADRNWEAWLLKKGHDPDIVPLIAQYASQLSSAGLDLSDSDLIYAFDGYFGSIETAIVATLKKASSSPNFNSPKPYLLAVLRNAR